MPAGIRIITWSLNTGSHFYQESGGSNLARFKRRNYWVAVRVPRLAGSPCAAAVCGTYAQGRRGPRAVQIAGPAHHGAAPEAVLPGGVLPLQPSPERWPATQPPAPRQVITLTGVSPARIEKYGNCAASHSASLGAWFSQAPTTAACTPAFMLTAAAGQE